MAAISDYDSKRKNRALQPDDKIDISFIILTFRVKHGRWPSMQEVRQIRRRNG